MGKRGRKPHKFGYCKVCKKIYPRNKMYLRKSRNNSIGLSLCKECKIKKFFGEFNLEYRLYKKSECEECGFRGHPCQLKDIRK